MYFCMLGNILQDAGTTRQRDNYSTLAALARYSCMATVLAAKLRLPCHLGGIPMPARCILLQLFYT